MSDVRRDVRHRSELGLHAEPRDPRSLLQASPGLRERCRDDRQFRLHHTPALRARVLPERVRPRGHAEEPRSTYRCRHGMRHPLQAHTPWVYLEVYQWVFFFSFFLFITLLLSLFLAYAVHSPEVEEALRRKNKFRTMLKQVVNVSIWKRKKYVVWASAIPIALFGWALFVYVVVSLFYIRSILCENIMWWDLIYEVVIEIFSHNLVWNFNINFSHIRYLYETSSAILITIVYE